MSNLKHILLITVFVLTLSTISICFPNSDTQDSNKRIADTCACSKKEYQIYNLPILFLDFGELAYNKRSTVPNKKKNYDDNLIPLHDYKGRLNYHPVFLAQHALHLIDVYNSTHNSKYLNTARSISDKLISISLPINSSIFFPYNTFDFQLHGYPEDTMYSPWYSGMAQGQILSLFVRLYEMTHENYYLEISKSILNSFDITHHNDTGKPWVSCVDDNGFLWFEEYPRNPPAYTLNGMFFATFGVYDYYRVTKDSKAEQLLRGAIRTIKSNIGRFRTPNGIRSCPVSRFADEDGIQTSHHQARRSQGCGDTNSRTSNGQ